MTRDKGGQGLVPGFLDAVAGSARLQTDGELPGGGDLFRAPVARVVVVQSSLGPVLYGACPRCFGALAPVALDVSGITDTGGAVVGDSEA